MANFFYDMGKMVGQGQRKAEWVLQSLTGGENESIEAEYAVGRDLAQSFAKEAKVENDPEVQQFLDAVAARLIECVADTRRVFTFRAVHQDEFNAFAYPGGFIFVTMPLLETCKWDADETAFVLGHEMGHVLARHAVNRMMANSMIRGSLSRLPIGGLLGMGVFQVATSLLNQGYSREQELEADYMGIKLIHYAGFNTDGAKNLLLRLSSIPSQKWLGSTYFSSHPPASTRMEQIERHLKELK